VNAHRCFDFKQPQYEKTKAKGKYTKSPFSTDVSPSHSYLRKIFPARQRKVLTWDRSPARVHHQHRRRDHMPSPARLESHSRVVRARAQSGRSKPNAGAARAEPPQTPPLPLCQHQHSPSGTASQTSGQHPAQPRALTPRAERREATGVKGAGGRTDLSVAALTGSCATRPRTCSLRHLCSI